MLATRLAGIKPVARRVSHTRTAHTYPFLHCGPGKSQSTQPTSAAARARVVWEAGRNVGMQSLQDKASEWSGVAAADAFAIDDVNIFESLGGTPQPFVDLSTNFYTRSVHRLPVPLLFSSALSHSDLECFRPSPVEFLVSWSCLDRLDFIGFMRTRRSGFGRYSGGPRRRMPSRTSMSS